jgi:hypothetical protein
MRLSGVLFSILFASAHAYAQLSIDVGSASGTPGDRVSFDVTVNGVDQPITGAQADIAFDSINTPIAATATGDPDCWVNPTLPIPIFGFAFRPLGCTGAACTMFRAIVLSVSLLPNGVVLYSCNADIAPTAPPGSYPLTISSALMSDPAGNAVVPIGSDGAIIVVVDEPTSKDDCKNGGWRDFTSPRQFKSQGDCIQYVNTGK